jgi:chromate reductase
MVNFQFVVLVGSLRKQSYHAALARSLQEVAPEGVTFSILASPGLLPHYNADLQAEGFPSEVVEMGHAIARSDGAIIVTPEYNYSVPGVLKNALDWLSRLPDTPFAGKPVAIQTGSPGLLGGARAQYHLRQILVFLDAHVLNKPEVMVSQMPVKFDASSGALTDPVTREFLKKQISAFVSFASLINSKPLDRA